MPEPPTLSDGIVVLDGFTDDDVATHVAGEDEEHARRLPADYAFDELGAQRVEALVEPDNEASHGVLRRAGFVRQGLSRKRTRFGDEMRDMVMYSLLPEDR